MIRRADVLLGVLAGMIILATVAWEVSAMLRLRGESAERVSEARRLTSEIDGHDFAAPAREEQRYAGQVFAGWGEIPPLKETLDRYDFYLSPRRR